MQIGFQNVFIQKHFDFISNKQVFVCELNDARVNAEIASPYLMHNILASDAILYEIQMYESNGLETIEKFFENVISVVLIFSNREYVNGDLFEIHINKKLSLNFINLRIFMVL